MSGYRPAQWVPQVERKRSEATAAQEARGEGAQRRLDAAIARRQRGHRRDHGRPSPTAGSPTAGGAPRGDPRGRPGAFATAAGKRNEVQRYLVGKFEAELRPPAETLASLLAAESPRERDLIRTLEASNAADEAKQPTFAEIRAFYDLPGEPKTPILRRGDYLQPGPRGDAGRPARAGHARAVPLGAARRRTPPRAAGGWRSPSG